MKSALSTATEKATKDRDRLFRHYRIAKKAEFDRLYVNPEHGDRLRKFAATLNHFGIDDADNMVEYVKRQAASMRDAPDDIRHGALELVSRRIVHIRQQAGLAPFDDPMPGDDDDVFQICRRELST